MKRVVKVKRTKKKSIMQMENSEEEDKWSGSEK